MTLSSPLPGECWGPKVVADGVGSLFIVAAQTWHMGDSNEKTVISKKRNISIM